VEGFSEKGAPAGWDTALGKVRGYRVWVLRLPLKPLGSVSLTRRPFTISPWGKSRDFSSSPVFPVLSEAHVEGLYGGHWNQRHQRDGWHHADCAGSVVSSFSAPSQNLYGFDEHKPPMPGCGCGYWAYWNAGDSAEFRTQRAWVKKIDYMGYEVLIPLSGVIDGSGATIIGSRGFRTARARITDLAIPSDSCVYEEGSRYSYENTVFASGGWISGPATPNYCNSYIYLRQLEVPFTSLLSDITGVPPRLVQETVRDAVTECLGGGFTWHDDVSRLIAACPPDENYGT